MFLKKILFLTLINIILHIVEILIYVILSNQNIALFDSVHVSGVWTVSVHHRLSVLRALPSSSHWESQLQIDI